MSSMASKIVAIIILVVSLLGATAGGVYLNSPKVVASRALEDMVTDLFKRDEIEPLVDTVKNGSIAFSAGEIRSDERTMFENGKLSGKMYFSDGGTFSKPAFMLSDLQLNLGEYKFSGDLYISEKDIYVNEDEVLGGAYGINTETFAEDLANSIFAPDSGSEYALDQELYDMIIKAFENSKDNKELTKDTKKLFKKVFKDIKKIVFDNAEFESDGSKERLNGDKKNVRVITITIDDDALASIIEEVYEYLRDSDDIKDYLDEHEDKLDAFASELYSKEEYDSLSEAYTETLKKAEDQIETICDNLNFGDLDINIMTPKASAKFLKLEIDFDGETVFSLDCGKKGMKNTDHITVNMGGMIFEYERPDTKGGIEEAVMTVRSEGSTDKVQITITLDKKDESYEIEFYDVWHFGDKTRYQKYRIKGDYVKKGNATTMTIDTITETTMYGDEPDSTTYKLKNYSFTFDTKDKMPDPIEDYKRIDDIDESDIEAWITKIEDLIPE